MARAQVPKRGPIGKSLLFGNCFTRRRAISPIRNLTSNKQESSESVQRSVADNLSLDYAGEIESHFEFMPDHYFRASRLADIVEHLKLFRSFFQNVSGSGEFPLSPAINWKIVPEHGHSFVTFCTWERERL